MRTYQCRWWGEMFGSCKPQVYGSVPRLVFGRLREMWGMAGAAFVTNIKLN